MSRSRIPPWEVTRAEEAYRETLAIWQTLKNRNLDAFTMDLAQLSKQFGWFLWTNRNLPEAEAVIREARDGFGEAISKRGDSEEIQHLHALMQGWLSGLCEQQGRREECLEMNRVAIEAYMRLLKAHPENDLYRHNLGAGYRWLAQVHIKAGRMEEAVAAYRTAISFRRQAARLESAGPESWVDPTGELKMSPPVMHLWGIEQKPLPNERLVCGPGKLRSGGVVANDESDGGRPSRLPRGPAVCRETRRVLAECGGAGATVGAPTFDHLATDSRSGASGRASRVRDYAMRRFHVAVQRCRSANSHGRSFHARSADGSVLRSSGFANFADKAEFVSSRAGAGE